RLGVAGHPLEGRVDVVVLDGLHLFDGEAGSLSDLLEGQTKLLAPLPEGGGHPEDDHYPVHVGADPGVAGFELADRPLQVGVGSMAAARLAAKAPRGPGWASSFIGAPTARR